MANINLDRGIIKWLPFDALSGYKEAIQKLKEKRAKKEKPILSEDQIAMLNYQLTLSQAMKKDIIVYYYFKGEIKFLNGVIRKLDFVEKKINIGSYWVNADAILLIEIN